MALSVAAGHLPQTNPSLASGSLRSCQGLLRSSHVDVAAHFTTICCPMYSLSPKVALLLVVGMSPWDSEWCFPPVN